ncbi:MAG: hypothetical protein PIR02_16895 [Microbacterium enclense]
MKGRRSEILIASLLSLALLSGCSAIGAQTPEEDPADDAVDDQVGATVPFPRVTSCDEVTAAIPAFAVDMDLVGEAVDDSGIMCLWAAPEGGPSASILVAQNTMPTEEESAAAAKMINLESTYFTNPQLSALGGVATRWTADGSPDTVGYTTVYVPGVSVEMHRGEDGPDGDTSYAPDDTEAIDVALAILKL